MEAYYANIVTYRVTATEFVLEFGSFFVGQGGRATNNENDTVARVVMNADILESFMNILATATEARDKHRQERPKQFQVGGPLPS